MASLKKFNSTTWDNAKVHKYGTDTDIFTTLPANIYADGNNATVGIVGNMQQAGTPTPDNPIQPSECGERTGNLLFAPDTGTIVSVLTISYTTNSSEFILNKNVTDNNVSSAVNCNIALDAETYSITVQGLNTAGVNLDHIYLVDSNNTIIVQNIVNNISVQFTLTEATTIAKISFVAAASSVYNNQVVSIMLNTGSTALPYQPYGYKIPISSANTTTPIYLGEVETTRKIKKLVLTGEENTWTQSDAASNTFYFKVEDYLRQRINITICSHYTSQANIISGAEMRDGNVSFYANAGQAGQSFYYFYVRDSNLATVADLKSYLAAQYTAGTPVTVWYVLATEETGIVNEPLRKIGDYADTVSSISIPTTTGADSFDVLTTLKPSEVSLGYTGWHDATVKSWDGSQWQ